MSYEGYIQILCKNGHLRELDAMESYYGEHRCDACGEPLAFENHVDQTNGCYTEDGSPLAEDHTNCASCSQRIQFEIDREEEVTECSCCGHMTLIREATYKIPSK